MEIATLCAVIASLQAIPNRSQFIKYESVSFSLNCDQQGNSTAWRVMRNTSKQINSLCPSYSLEKKESTCFIDNLYEIDSGVYWCESETGKSSNAVIITVTSGELILESPALPALEGEDLVLQCRTRRGLSDVHLTKFYKDEIYIGSSSKGNITLHSVSKSDEGLYKCLISKSGESPNSWLSVRGLPESPCSLQGNIVLPVMVTSISLFLVILLFLLKNHQAEFSVVLYSGIINKQACTTKGHFQSSHSSVSSTRVVYRPVLRRGQARPRVWTYKA